MPTLIRRLTPAGLLPVDYQANSLAEAASFEPYDGIYTVTNTYRQVYALKLNAHLDRMEDSAQRAGIPLKLERTRLREALRSMIIEAGYPESRFRITVPKAAPDEMIITVEPYTPPADQILQTGIVVTTLENSARHNAAAKTNDWLHDRAAIEHSLPPGVYTALLCSEAGDVLEGLSSNFYGILNGELRTAGEGVLAGIAQQIVFEIAPSILHINKRAVHLSELPTLEEAFITSSSRGIIPVVQIDGRPVGSGQPGPLTVRLRAAYGTWAEAHLEAI